MGFSQNNKAFVDTQVAQKMAALEMQQNPEYFYRMVYCEGKIQSFTMPGGISCTSNSTYYAVYVFWKEDKDKFKMQKFDNCGSFIPFQVNFNKNINRILEEKLELKQEKFLKNINSEPLSVQPCYTDYKFVFGGQSFEKNYENSKLLSDGNKKNLKHNNALLIVKLEAEISQLIRSLDEKGKFFREN